MLAANAHLAPGYADGLKGIARSMPTSAAADRVAEKPASPLRDPHRLEVLRQPAQRRHGHDLRRGECGHRLKPRPREGRPLGGAALAQHPRRRKQPAKAIAEATGREYGRNYYARHDYEGIDTAAANGLVDDLRARLAKPARHQDRRPKVDGPTIRLPRPGRRLDLLEPGHPHPVRGRQPRRLPPVRHRHLRRHAPRLHRALRARPPASSLWRPATPSPT